MARITINPVYEWSDERQRYILVSHSGQYDAHVPLLFDRGATSSAKQQGKQAAGVAGTAGSNATTDRSSVIPGLIQQANNPTGYSATDLNAQKVAAGSSLGGASSGITGTANLEAARTRNAGGFGAALDEASREKGRQLANANLGVDVRNADLKQQQQQQARGQLLGLYNTDTSNQLRAMGLQGQDLQDQLAAGRQGWLQNTDATITALGSLGKGSGCWVAAELYGGWSAPEVDIIRTWLSSTWYMRPFWMAYTTFGQTWAKWVRENPEVRKFAKILFDRFLKQARG